jgi:hypothetical protein
MKGRAWDRVRISHTVEALGLERNGTGVFMLKFGERTRALDWHWYISGQLEMSLPKQIDIRIPSLSQTVRLVIPEEAASTTINAESTRRLLWNVVLSNSTRRELMLQLGELPRIELAWKGPDSTLDWVAYHTTVTGKSREWALLASFAQLLQGGRHAVLQARVAEHRALKMRLDDGTLLDEPPAVEGYLTLHRANGPKELIYASSIEGVVFIAPANDAMPPLIPKRPGSMPAALFPEVFREFRCNEQRRMTSFIEKCTGCIDLRDIVDVVLRKPRDEPEGGELSTRPLVVHATSGHISTRKPTSKAGDKKEREFNVTFRNGNVVAFEAHTPDVAREWVWHLSQLVEYWTRYHRVHARLQMSTNTLHARAWVSELDRHMEEALNKVWNWCIIDGCRAITMCSRLYVKRGKYRKFKSVNDKTSGLRPLR